MVPYVSQFSVYGLRLSSERHYRYVGQTSKEPRVRLTQHARSARSGSTQPIHEWMRECGPENVVCDVLEQPCPTEDYLSYAESYWIQELRSFGHDLLNAKDGGAAGPRGVRWSTEQRTRVSGAGNPFHGRKHSDETRARMSASAPRRSGSDHHLHGKKQSAEHIAKRIGNNDSPAQKAHSRKLNHVRWHERRNIVKPDCNYCKSSEALD